MFRRKQDLPVDVINDKLRYRIVQLLKLLVVQKKKTNEVFAKLAIAKFNKENIVEKQRTGLLQSLLNNLQKL